MFGLWGRRGVGGGSGSDVAEEPAVRDAEPVTQVSSRSRLSSRTLLLRAAFGVDPELSVDRVTDVAFQRTDRFFLRAAFREFALHIAVPVGVRLAWP